MFDHFSSNTWTLVFEIRFDCSDELLKLKCVNSTGSRYIQCKLVFVYPPLNELFAETWEVALPAH